MTSVISNEAQNEKESTASAGRDGMNIERPCMIGEICTFKIITVSLTSAEYLP